MKKKYIVLFSQGISIFMSDMGKLFYFSTWKKQNKNTAFCYTVKIRMKYFFKSSLPEVWKKIKHFIK